MAPEGRPPWEWAGKAELAAKKEREQSRKTERSSWSHSPSHICPSPPCCSQRTDFLSWELRAHYSPEFILLMTDTVPEDFPDKPELDHGFDGMKSLLGFGKMPFLILIPVKKKGF